MVGTMIREDTTSRIYTVALRYLIGFFTSTDTYPPFGVPVAGVASIASGIDNASTWLKPIGKAFAAV